MINKMDAFNNFNLFLLILIFVIFIVQFLGKKNINEKDNKSKYQAPPEEEVTKHRSWKISTQPAVGSKIKIEQISKMICDDLESSGAKILNKALFKISFIKEPDFTSKGFMGDIEFQDNETNIGISVTGKEIQLDSTAKSGNIAFRVMLSSAGIWCFPCACLGLIPAGPGSVIIFNVVDNALKKVAKEFCLNIIS
jgi:hypothetical protein